LYPSLTILQNKAICIIDVTVQPLLDDIVIFGKLQKNLNFILKELEARGLAINDAVKKSGIRNANQWFIEGNEGS